LAVHLNGTGLVPVPALSGSGLGAEASGRFRNELQPWHPSPPLGWGRWGGGGPNPPPPRVRTGGL